MHNWNLAYRETKQTGVLKKELVDFQVTEELSFTPAGEGEHLYLRLRKTGLTTPQVRKMLQDAHRVPAMDVSYAGLKDRHGICEQWFSVRAPQEIPDLIDGEGLQELERTWHTTKLRRGQILKNQFKIRLRNLVIDEELSTRFTLIAKQGAPNYFGAQRFGHKGENIPAAKAWLQHRRSRRIDPFMKGIYLSTLRSLLFNSILSARVTADNWNQSISGDVLLDDYPTGPLWGRGRSATEHLAAEIEKATLVEFAEICGDLEYAGVNQARRSLVLMPQEFSWVNSDADAVDLRFALNSGSYATVLLRECLQVVDHSVERAA